MNEYTEDLQIYKKIGPIQNIYNHIQKNALQIWLEADKW